MALFLGMEYTAATESCMKEIGQIAKKMVMENSHQQMARFMRVIG